MSELRNRIRSWTFGSGSSGMTSGLTAKERNELRRSRVRVRITYAAAAYIFGGSAVLIAALWIDNLSAEKLNIARDVFMMVLPVATGVVTYWFASRKPDEPQARNTEGGGPQAKPQAPPRD